jgi:uncharacterized protein (DUF58 family)
MLSRDCHGNKMSDTISFLNPEHLAPIRNLNLRARRIVEGMIAGMHKSPYHGFSAEFLEYRPYRTGESSARIDWRKYAKTDRSLVRLYEDETNLFATILLDKSGSMKFRHGSAMSKHDYARTLAASLAWILIRQRDAVGLFAFDLDQCLFIPPRSTNVQLSTILSNLDKMEPAGETRCGASIERLARTLRKRGLCIVISDLLDDPDDIIRGLRHLRFKRQDIVVIRILDPFEATFRSTGSCEVRDLETGNVLLLDGLTASEYFKDGLARHHRLIDEACRSLHIDCETVVTNEPFARALVRILHKRKRLF